MTRFNRVNNYSSRIRHEGDRNFPEHQHRYAYEFGRFEPRPDSGEQRSRFDRMQEARDYYQQRNGYPRDEYYSTMYETSNYYATPRSTSYGLPHGTENDLDTIDHFARPDWVYGDRRTPYRYSMGYNPNYDNPEEGDVYRNFDSRGNFGYRHDASYGNADEFRDFGNDHYGDPSRANDSYNRRYTGRNDERW